MRSAAKWQIAGLTALGLATVGVVAVAVAPDKTEATAGPNLVAPVAAAPVIARPGVKLVDNPVVLFAGDSLSDGWYATEEVKGFRPIVSGALTKARPSSTFVQAHKAGYTTQQVADTFPVPEGINLAVVQLGTNDVTKKTNPGMFAGQYAAYVDAIKSKNPDAGLICLGSFFHAAEQSDAIDKVIEAECNKHDGFYLDITAVYVTAGYRGPAGTPTWLGKSDMGHPNDLGHARIAEMVLSQIITEG
jgi:lysophospholipase L1-like esterase